MKIIKVNEEPLRCPECGGRIVPIIYGEATYDEFIESEKGNLVLGGCIVDFGEYGNCLAPTWECKKCHVKIIVVDSDN